MPVILLALKCPVLKLKVKKPKEPVSDCQFLERTTPAQRFFEECLANALREAADLSVDLHSEYLIAIARTRSLKSRLRRCSKKEASIGPYVIRRADLFLAAFLLVIEVDGNIHHDDQAKATSDAATDILFAGVGIGPPCRITNEHVYDDVARNRIIAEIIAECRRRQADPAFAKHAAKISKRISRALTQLCADYPEWKSQRLSLKPTRIRPTKPPR